MLWPFWQFKDRTYTFLFCAYAANNKILVYIQYVSGVIEY